MSQSVPDPAAESAPEPAPAEPGMTLGEHLDELRVRLFKGVIAVLICFIAAWILRNQAYEVFMGPFEKGVGMLRSDWLAVSQQVVGGGRSCSRSSGNGSSVGGNSCS